jgi:uncharacterized protein
MPETIEAAEEDYLYIEPSQIPNSGQGLFTAIDIYKGEVISLFKGEILTQEEVKLRESRKEHQYFICLLDGRMMDSKNVECFAKYANDAIGKSKSTFTNNAKITLDDDGNVCLVATKNIKGGSEIFASYGVGYWSGISKKR